MKSLYFLVQWILTSFGLNFNEDLEELIIFVNSQLPATHFSAVSLSGVTMINNKNNKERWVMLSLKFGSVILN